MHSLLTAAMGKAGSCLSLFVQWLTFLILLGVVLHACSECANLGAVTGFRKQVKVDLGGCCIPDLASRHRCAHDCLCKPCTVVTAY